MHINYNEELGKFVIKPDPYSLDLEDCRSIPHRKYDKTNGLWIAGPTKSNARYLLRWHNKMTPEAKAACERIQSGAIIKKGAPPVGFQFKTEPFPHQLEPFLRSIDLDSYALLMDPGTGKSKVLIDDTVAAFLGGKINGALVICPNSIKTNWEDEIRIHGHGNHEIFLYDPDKKKAAERWIMESHPFAVKWLVMAVESFSQGTADRIAEKFLTFHRASFIIDESSRIKTHDTVRTKKILKLRKFATRARIATGTPISKGVHQAWAQFEFLSPDILDMGYYAFRNHFCIMGGFKGKQIVGTMNEEQFIDLVAPYTYRANKNECLKLPPKVYQVRKVQPTEEQRKLYETLRDEGMAEGEDGFVSFTNTLVRDLRLQQICGGFVALTKDEEMPEDITDVDAYFEAMARRTKAEPIPGKNPKIEELMEVLDEAGSKAIIWSRFKPEIRAIVEALRKEYGHNAVVEFHGDISEDDRALARRRFQNDPSCMFFVGQIDTGGIGITLTAAPLVVYFGDSWSLENRIQSEDRAHRIGQTADSVLYVNIVIDGGKKPWVDFKILEALRAGKNYTDAVMERIKQATDKAAI